MLAQIFFMLRRLIKKSKFSLLLLFVVGWFFFGLPMLWRNFNIPGRINAASAALNQCAYRFFYNTDSTDVGAVLNTQDTAATTTATTFRMRMLLCNTVAQLNASSTYWKLQFASRGADNSCDTSFTGETYADVGSATTIAYNDNTTPLNGATLTDNANDPNHGADTIINQTYVESNNFTSSVANIPADQDGKWDFSLKDNGSLNAVYCLRVTGSNDVLLDTYSVIPQIALGATAPTSTLSAATSVATSTATLNGDVTAVGGENPTVTMYWGTTDGGQTPGSWSSSSTPTSPAQPQGVASFYTNVTGLSPATLYYFSAKATNTGGTGWPAASLSFRTATSTPTITLSSATNITTSTATINGNVTATGGDNPTITMYWGLTDGGQTPGSWTYNSAPTSPSQPQGVAAFYTDITSLTSSTIYYFSAKATNSAGTSWPAASLTLTTNALNTTISCSTNITSTTFPTLTTVSVATSTPNASTTMSCSGTSSGCTLYVKDAGGGGNPGLWNSTASTLIPSPNAAYGSTATLAAGTAGYGIQATSTSVGLSIASRYNKIGNNVGGLSVTNLTLASSTANISDAITIVTHKAAISENTLAGTYTDTVTYSCVVN